MIKYSLLLLSFITLASIVSGCGSKSGSDATISQATTVQASTVQGIAAAGNPIAGTVILCDSSTNTISAKTTVAGEFSIDTTGLRAPFILKSVDNLNNEMFSYASAPGTVNINPLTTLAVAVASGATDSTSLTDLYDHYTKGTATAITQMQMIISTASITTSLQPLLASFGAATANPFTDPYLVNHQGLDDLFDKVAITISSGGTNSSAGMVVITRRDDNTPVFTALLSDLMTGAVHTNNIPAPAPPANEMVPGNSQLTLKVQGVLPQGALIKNASFSIRLPSGITVVTRQSMPATLVDYMAIPIGTAVGSNLYPAPTLSAVNNNILQISLSSVTGFSAGDFLTIWYIDTSPYSIHMRTPSDFTITDAKFYSDIYKSHELQNITIVPDSISILYKSHELKMAVGQKSS